LPTSPAQHQARIDTLMEQASQHLVHRRYFEAEETCLEALRKAQGIRDFDRMARLILPLQEARRQKRDLAIDAGDVFLVDGEVPSGKQLVAGCYLVSPPRVGVDGRGLREAADKKRVPIIVAVREPTTRDGLWPIVAVGPVTIRAKVKPPAAPVAKPAPKAKVTKKTAGKGKAPKAVAEPAAPTGPVAPPLPPPEWFVYANEQLGDAAIAEVNEESHPVSQVDALIEYLQAHPDHEKLHQRLADAARAAARDPRPPRRPSTMILEDDEEDEGSEKESED
jgi:hypothetical protein